MSASSTTARRAYRSRATMPYRTFPSYATPWTMPPPRPRAFAVVPLAPSAPTTTSAGAPPAPTRPPPPPPTRPPAAGLRGGVGQEGIEPPALSHPNQRRGRLTHHGGAVTEAE